MYKTNCMCPNVPFDNNSKKVFELILIKTIILVFSTPCGKILKNGYLRRFNALNHIQDSMFSHEMEKINTYNFLTLNR